MKIIFLILEVCGSLFHSLEGSYKLDWCENCKLLQILVLLSR